MPQKFIECDREQAFLMPPSLRDWLPDDHLAWFMLASAEELDLSAFYSAYRQDGHGRPAHDPQMMVALLLYAYAKGQRSSRGIERECTEDIAYRVITANQRPDHTTIARFRQRHETALSELFGDVLGLCSEAGLLDGRMIAIDGTKMHASASRDATSGYERIAREIVEEAAEIDQQEDELFGDRRGDELPAQLASNQGRRGWLRDARKRLEERRAEEARPIPCSRPERLHESKRRLEEELAVERQANDAYEAYRARGVMRDGRRFGTPPKPYEPPTEPTGKVNVTDPDSRVMKSPRGFLQGYNAQAATNENQIVIAAEITTESPDFGHLEPMVDATEAELRKAGVESPSVVVADAGYWHREQMGRITDRGIEVLIPPDAGNRKGNRPGWEGGPYESMRQLLASERGAELYGKRKAMVEPVFAQTKFNRRIDRFQRRGRSAVRSEWRLITATHNLMKLHRLTLAAETA